MLRSGHAPGHVRDTFLNAISAFMEWDQHSGEPEPAVEFEVNYVQRQILISQACSLVWNCTDIMPGLYCHWLRRKLDIKCSTYAACARAMRATIKGAQ